MLNHIVLMRLNSQVDDNVIGELQNYANRIRDEIKEVRHYQIAPNIAAGSKGLNWAIISKFDSESDMQNYKNNRLHQDFVTFCDPYTEDVLTLDYC